MFALVRTALFFSVLALQAQGIQQSAAAAPLTSHDMATSNPPSLVQAVPEKKQQGTTATTDVSQPSWMWSHPLLLGLVLGFVLIGPDHLGTLMALSTLTSGFDSFKVGFWWGLGHSLGMILICPIFCLLKQVGSKKFNISMDRWEYYGDYFIGASLILVALYFVKNESQYLEKQQDGTYKAKGCSCHRSLANATATEALSPEDEHKFCKAYGVYCSPKCDQSRKKKLPVSQRSFTSETAPPPCPDAQEDSPLIEQRWVLSTLRCPNLLSLRDLHGVVIGTLQGLCCPMGLAAMVFLGHVSISASPMALFAFASSMVLSSAFGSGGLALGWGALTTRGVGTCLSARGVYRASCIVTLALGICWIAANAAGVLDSINFAEKALDRQMAPMTKTE